VAEYIYISWHIGQSFNIRFMYLSLGAHLFITTAELK